MFGFQMHTAQAIKHEVTFCFVNFCGWRMGVNTDLVKKYFWIEKNPSYVHFDHIILDFCCDVNEDGNPRQPWTNLHNGVSIFKCDFDGYILWSWPIKTALRGKRHSLVLSITPSHWKLWFDQLLDVRNQNFNSWLWKQQLWKILHLHGVGMRYGGYLKLLHIWSRELTEKKIKHKKLYMRMCTFY